MRPTKAKGDTAAIRNLNTRRAYARAVVEFFARCAEHRLTMRGIEPVHVATAYAKPRTQEAAPDAAEGPFK
jgi:integrase/recombinase XerD